MSITVAQTPAAWLDYEPEDITAEPLAEVDRNLIENYFISLAYVEDDDEMKVSIALELFALLDQALFYPENDDLYEDFSCLVEELAAVPAYAAALAANDRYQLIDDDIKSFMSHWKWIHTERERQLAEDVAAEEAYAAKYCRRCDDVLEANEANTYGYRYCHHCTLAQIDAEFL